MRKFYRRVSVIYSRLIGLISYLNWWDKKGGVLLPSGRVWPKPMTHTMLPFIMPVYTDALKLNLLFLIIDVIIYI